MATLAWGAVPSPGQNANRDGIVPLTQNPAIDVADTTPARLPSLRHSAFYHDLLRAREQYDALPNHAWETPLPRPAGGKLVAGDAYEGIITLARRLVVLGDLSPHVPIPVVYEGVVVSAVEAFQQRHGLTVDGVVGAATLAALAATPRQRAAQIERNLKRLEQSPPLRGRYPIVVNLPEFVLRVYEPTPTELELKEEMRIIVGRALNTSTPLFNEDIHWVEFSPYWNVPQSIARRETIPRLQRDPGYFERQGFEFVMGDGRVVRTLSGEALTAVANGQARLRQRPGPLNAMGSIKFVLPNNRSIYLHHTSSVDLFGRVRRDLSHGCIRVEEPVALARRVLAGLPGWTDERIGDAMHGGRAFTVRLDAPVQVLAVYSTVAVKNGTVHFFPDVYGRDGPQAAAPKPRAPAVAGEAARAHDNLPVPSTLHERR